MEWNLDVLFEYEQEHKTLLKVMCSHHYKLSLSKKVSRATYNVPASLDFWHGSMTEKREFFFCIKGGVFIKSSATVCIENTAHG